MRKAAAPASSGRAEPPPIAPLKHVLWLGGPPASGKTTIATRLMRRHGLRWYNADAHTWEHRDRALRDRNPAALRWEAMTAHERWVMTPPAEMVELSLNLERGPMIVDDLRRLPRSRLILAEGSTVLPELVPNRVADPSRARRDRTGRGTRRARENDDPECDEVVELAVAAFSRSGEVGPVLADGHG